MARTLRPSKFKDIIGQETVVRLITQALERNIMLPVCTIFGPSGIGKTTLARLIALWQCCTAREYSDEVNNINTSEPCGNCANCMAILNDNHPDVFELDGGTYTGVDDIKSMLQSANYSTASMNINNRKIYILDEVHMISRHALTALLKRFEEPMDNLQFILATTNIEKLPDTILSRSFMIKLETVDAISIEKYLTKICAGNEYKCDTEALGYIAESAGGSIRYALSMLEQATILCANEISAEPVRKMLGLPEAQVVESILQAFYKQDINALLNALAEIRDINPNMAMKQILARFRIEIEKQGASNEMIQVAYELAESAIVMHRYPYSDRLLEICLGYVLVKNRKEQHKLSELAKKMF